MRGDGETVRRDQVWDDVDVRTTGTCCPVGRAVHQG